MKLSRYSTFSATFLASAILWTACGAPNNDDGGSGGDSGDGDTGGGSSVDGNLDGGIDGGGETPNGSGYTPIPWPDAPVIDAGAPANAAELFGGAPGGAGPCVHEPQDGSLVPKNWLRPRFRLTPAAGENLFEIQLTSDKADGKTLTIYTTNAAYAMEGGYFSWIGGRGGGAPVTVGVRVRATTTSGGAVSATETSFSIAPANAGGSMVYWATRASGNSLDATKLVGFSVGEEGTVDALLPAQITERGYVIEDGSPMANPGAQSGQVTCIGCHTSTPDGGAVAFNGNWPWPGVVASVEEESVGQRPNYVTDTGMAALKMPFIGTLTFSKGAWGDGQRKAVGVIQDPKSYEGWNMWDGATRNIVAAADLAWFDLGAAGSATPGNTSVDALRGTLWNTIPRTGDTRAVANPAWSNDASTIAYASCAQVAGGHPGGINAADGITPLTSPTECDIYKVPFADGAGGQATPLAAESGVAEYYPDFSFDDALVAYTRVPTTTGYLYYRPDGEIYVVKSEGGAPVRLAANDPPSNSAACPSEASPGVLNSWPKWSPSGETAGGDKYYWLIFSSGRSYPEQFDLAADQWTPTNLDRRSSQLYLAAVVVKADGSVQTYPATYIWNQTKDTANLTPAWDEFKIPPVPVPR